MSKDYVPLVIPTVFSRLKYHAALKNRNQMQMSCEETQHECLPP